MRFCLIILQLCIVTFLLSTPVRAQELKPIQLDPTYEHDKWHTRGNGIIKNFRAYVSSFDDLDDDDEYGGADAWGVPEYVAYEMRKIDQSCIKTHKRPRKWITDKTLHDDGIMSKDDSYRFSRDFRSKHKAWFVRGHLAMKLHAERLGGDAAWNTHTFYNAVPQRQDFNAGIWLDLEDLTAAWAQRYGKVWIITGPVFKDKYPFAHLGEEGEFPIGIPEALFKIAVKEAADGGNPDVLAFLYPQVGPGYTIKPYDHTRYLTSVDEIEELTGIDFLTELKVDQERIVEQKVAREIWTAEPQDFIHACGSNMNFN